MNAIEYMDDRLGFFDSNDQAWIMDDYGDLKRILWSINWWYWQEI